MMNHNMDVCALNLVAKYVEKHLGVKNTVRAADKAPHIVWKCNTLQNCKYLIGTNLLDGMYYEVTYNGDRQEWYLDAYKKVENECYPLEESFE
nr:MAG TPA: hypothetical protein [Caudoviricetes sp.]